MTEASSEAIAPFSLPTTVDRLRATLPALDRATEYPDPLLLKFCALYGIDFGQQRKGVTHFMGYINSGNYKLCTHVFRQKHAKSTLLLVHGYLDHSGLFSHLISWGLDLGFDVIIFDLPGHGLSTGTPTAINHFGEYAQAISDVVTTCQLDRIPCIAIGQSTGCAALLEYAKEYDYAFKRTVFLAPLLRPIKWRAIWWTHLLASNIVKLVPRRFEGNSGDEQFNAFLKVDPLQSHSISTKWVGALKRWLATMRYKPINIDSTLIVQGDQDNTVDWRWNLPRFEKLLPSTQVMILQNAQHHLANETPELRACYLRVVEDYVFESRGVSHLHEAK